MTETVLAALPSSESPRYVGCWTLPRVKRRRIVSGSAVRSAMAVDELRSQADLAGVGQAANQHQLGWAECPELAELLRRPIPPHRSVPSRSPTDRLRARNSGRILHGHFAQLRGHRAYKGQLPHARAKAPQVIE